MSLERIMPTANGRVDERDRLWPTRYDITHA
jgi:hypothetical protein